MFSAKEDNLQAPETVTKELFPSSATPGGNETESSVGPTLLWGAELAPFSTGGNLTREIIEICNQIVEASAVEEDRIGQPAKGAATQTVNSLKMKLQEICGSMDKVWQF